MKSILRTIAAIAAVTTLCPLAIAAQPMRFEYPIDFTFKSARWTNNCGFPVFIHETGSSVATVFSGRDGQVVREVDTAPDYKETWFSPAVVGGTGGSFTVPGGGLLHTEYPDGVYLGARALITYVGMHNMLPGLPEAGRFTIDGEIFYIDENGIPYAGGFEILGDLHGHYPLVGGREAVCGALAAP